MTTPENRYSRNEALFGQEGQKQIMTSHVAIVGVGGLGSHVAQQLSFLGVRNQVLIDPDVVTQSSLNRLIGAVPADADEGKLKVDVVARMVRQILPESQVTSVPTTLNDSRALEAFASCSSAFGCVDDDRVRLELITFCGRNRIPYFDLATDTGGDDRDRWYGGRVLFSDVGQRCPACMDLLDQVSLRRSAMSGEELEVERRIYGVRADDLGASGPSVVGLNGVVASLAVMEWMVWATGLRLPNALLEYRGQAGGVFVSRDDPQPGCYYCSLWKAVGNGDAA